MKHFLLPALFAAQVQAGAFDPALVAADAAWWLHADLEAARTTALGERVVATLEEKKGPQLRAIQRMFSIHPLNDLKSVTLYGDGGKDRAVALIRGKFDRPHLEDIVAAAENHTAVETDGVLIHSWTDKGKRQHAFFARNDLLVFSHYSALLDSARTTLREGGMAPDAFTAAGSAPPFLVGSAELSEIEMDDDESELLGHADSLKIALAEAGGRMEGRLLVKTADRADGERFRKVMEGMIALGELANSALRDADMRFETRTEDAGRTVRGTLSMPSAEMIAMLEADGAFDKLGD